MNPALLTGQEMDEGLEEMWTESVQNISRINPSAENWKIQTLPLARIKKIMKSEEFILQELEKEKQQKAAEEGQPVESEKSGVKFMISGEAPVLMSKACELLIRDLSFRAWRHTERNRRRTLQRQDLHAAVGESEVYDFLIDIVPRVSTSKSSPADATVANAQTMAPQIPPGLPHMAGLPTVAQPMAAPPPVAQPMNALMDTNVMQQMQHSTTTPQPQQLQQGMVQQFADQQQPQHFQSYMSVPQLPSDNGQGAQLTTNNAPSATQAPQPQAIPQWMTQPVANTTNTSQPG
mmetsp:Transcript_9102/g.21661  ORF Transcript_9102/g.21661 Transcript_9102/m.21661 type:complete len:291 (+) Transcript_9102:132-1004(+)